MPFDHLIQNINLSDGTEGVDVGIRDEKIIAVEKNLDAEASVTTDGSNGEDFILTNHDIHPFSPVGKIDVLNKVIKLHF